MKGHPKNNHATQYTAHQAQQPYNITLQERPNMLTLTTLVGIGSGVVTQVITSRSSVTAVPLHSSDRE